MPGLAFFKSVANCCALIFKFARPFVLSSYVPVLPTLANCRAISGPTRAVISLINCLRDFCSFSIFLASACSAASPLDSLAILAFSARVCTSSSNCNCACCCSCASASALLPVSADNLIRFSVYSNELCFNFTLSFASSRNAAPESLCNCKY